jgi:multisubunit Na+/H+ antiporter MnhE subunit
LRDPNAPAIPIWRRIVWFFPFAAAVIVDIVTGTWQVMLIVFRIRPLERPGIIGVPVGDRSPTGMANSGLTDTRAPGSVLVDVDWEQRIAWLHVIDATDPDATREHLEMVYERFQRKVFP